MESEVMCHVITDWFLISLIDPYLFSSDTSGLQTIDAGHTTDSIPPNSLGFQYRLASCQCCYEFKPRWVTVGMGVNVGMGAGVVVYVCVEDGWVILIKN